MFRAFLTFTCRYTCAWGNWDDNHGSLGDPTDGTSKARTMRSRGKQGPQTLLDTDTELWNLNGRGVMPYEADSFGPEKVPGYPRVSLILLC